MQRNAKTPLSFRILKPLLLGVILSGFVFLPSLTIAQGWPVGDALTETSTALIASQDAAARAGNAAKDVAKNTLTTSIVTYLINLLTFAADKAAYEAAVRISSAGNGGTSLLSQEAWDGYWQDVGAASAGEAVGLLNEDITGAGGVLTGFNLCAPSSANILLSFKFGIKSVFERPEPKCDINLVTKEWKGFIADTASQVSGGQARNQHILTTLADAYDPNTNEFAVGVSLSSNVIDKAWTDQHLKVQQRLDNKGFKDVTDFITGQVKTPAEMINTDWLNKMSDEHSTSRDTTFALLQNTDALLQVGIHAGSIFANTLLSKMAERVYTGFFDVNPALENVNPFDAGAFAQTNTGASQARLKAIFTAVPLEISNFSILADFSACPSSNRGLYNCVADSSFVSAVARASSGVPMTVQEAMDDGLLKPDWPLIPSGDKARNQDPYCYSYGYCSSNLVKLRKARVISVGWEFAADSSFNDPNDPVTLREVVAGFNSCNAAGEPDQDHPWCKLIDPNWVLKYPLTQCRADVNGQLLTSSASNERQDECVDMPSCIAEDESGNCTGGYGYCVREENVWQFRGQTCPTQFASCITVKNEAKTASYLRNTTDPGPCTADNAGCQWYVNNKTKGSDGTFSFPEITSVATADADPNAYKNRTYFTGAVEGCDEAEGGCRELVVRDTSLSLNMLTNPSFEANTDNNTLPDGWNFSPTTGPVWDTTGAFSRTGNNALKTVSGIAYETAVEFSQSRFYTMSFYARQETTGGAEKGQMYIGFGADDNSVIELAGTSKVASANAQSCDFSDGNADGKMDAIVLTGKPAGTTYERFSCTFTSPLQANSAARLFAFVDMMPGKAWLDDIQVEQGPRATDYHDGYSSSTLNKEVVKVPPSYLGCTGASSDPAECASYAKVCSENDAGCSAYTPSNGDPVVTGVTTELDVCPASCVGYDTYKQEATLYEPSGVFPLYFIPDSAQTCTAQDVGCDEFTNLTDESKSYFTYVRACVTPAQAQANTSSDNAATFYTWEGSDNSGYQLKTWHLMESNLGSSDYTYATSHGTDTAPDLAPCSHFTTRTDGITCSDVIDTNADGKYDWDTSSCDEHNDIFTDLTGNCREFYDASGGLHYRDWSKTITVDDACTSYRKTDIAGADNAARQATCTTSGGFFESGSGICRYYGLSAESKTCSARANGCRSYTGGRSRNSRQAYQDFFEDGSLTHWTAASASTVTLSNESLATGGHSVSASAPFATYVGDYGTTCTTAEGCPKSGGALGATCTVFNGQRYCGTLEGELFSGKTYTLSFMAKGSGTLSAGFDYSATGSPSLDANFGSVTLTSGWQQYSLGPLNMNATGFGSGTALAFIPSASVFVDNIVLREGQDNITLIKNSWVTPAVCDQTPVGGASPQYSLGCQEYTTQDGNTVDVKSFSKLCADDKVGCASFFMTQESESPHAEVHNATCGTLDGSVATSATACYYGRTGNAYNTSTQFLCTIGVGSNSCPFNLSWYVAPNTLPTHLKYVASTVVTPADKDIFLVVTEDKKCSTDAKSCTEYGLPTYSQDKSSTSGAKSVFLKNDPAGYTATATSPSILCTQDALFCSAWTGTGGTQYYFKDPGDQTCEYQTNITVGGTSYDGWFKTGTSEFCYSSPQYVIGGNVAGIWKNGDSGYRGWVGTCDAQYDSCSEYQDPLAIEDNEIYSNSDGTPYFSLSSSLGSTSSSVTGVSCNGKVSLKAGCALFNDTSISAKNANSSATEIASRHADALFNTAPFTLVDPIDCDSNATTITTPSGTSVDLCARRCIYDQGKVHDITDGRSIATKLGIKAFGGTQYTVDQMYIFGSSCYAADDCAPVISESGETVKATVCGPGVYDDLTDDPIITPLVAPTAPVLGPRLKDDANTVLAVNRNRQCSEWLSCDDAQTVWDERTNSYKTVCGGVALCTEYSAQGNSSFCSKWNFEDPKSVLDNERYTSRDVTWYGAEYSGMAIPNLFPVQTLSQANVAPEAGTCDLTLQLADGDASQSYFDANNGKDCSTDADCGSGLGFAGSCLTEQGNDFRLILDAGECTGNFGASCTVGICENTGAACSVKADCGNSGGACMVGQCYGLTTTLCTSDAQCTGAGQVCAGGSCATPGNQVVTDSVGSGQTQYNQASPGTTCGSQTFVAKVGLKTGTCINKQCLLAPDGNPFESGTTAGKACRAYPETTSPFTSDIVESWLDPKTQLKRTSGTPGIDDIPYDTISGFEHAAFCQYGQDCLCSYKKVTYGQGSESRYYAKDYAPGNTGICTSSKFKGKSCGSNDDCTDDPENDPGTCAKASREDTLLGLDGYCLEHDAAINVNGDRDQSACITWLPVDQLAGSSDLYGKSTEAGWSADLFYCAEVKGYHNVHAFPGCSLGPGVNDVTSGNKAECRTTMNCPKGFFAVGGPASRKDSGHGSVNGATCVDSFGNGKNGCPFLCVPYNSFHVGTGKACGTPTAEGLDDTTDYQEGTLSYVDTGANHTKYYFANAADEDAVYSQTDLLMDPYKDCVYYGANASTDDLGELTYDYVRDLDGANANQDFKIPSLPSDGYAACEGLLQAGSAETNVFNAVWTDRLLNPTSDVTSISVGSKTIKNTTELPPFGHSLTAEQADLGRNLADAQTPAVIPACINETDKLIVHLPPDLDNPGVCESGYIPTYGNTENPAEAQSFLGWTSIIAGYREDHTGVGVPSGGETSRSSIVSDLRKLFATPMKIWSWASGNSSSTRAIGGPSLGSYTEGTLSTSYSGQYSWDDRDNEGNPPKIWAINTATCRGSECEEGPEDAITVNDQNTGDISSSRFLRASVKFYAAADKNQLPLRRIVVDWGDDPNNLPVTTDDNFYKNHRGLETNSANSKCESGSTEWGLTAESCDPNYITYSHIYTCPNTMLLNTDPSNQCKDTNGDGTLDVTPCVDKQGTADQACVYQPRVHIRDNWGWCSGVCTSGSDSDSGCYEATSLQQGNISSTSPNDECAYADPFGGPGSSKDPWVYYDGQVMVKP